MPAIGDVAVIACRAMRHHTSCTLLWLGATLCGIAAASEAPDAPATDATARPSALLIDGTSKAREVLAAIPPEAALERFELTDERGRTVSYVALTDTEVGGIVFVDGQLRGTVSKRDAQAFYSCRGHATATRAHWGQDGAAWADSLLASATPAQQVPLKFSGKSTYQSIKAVVDSPGVAQVKSLVDMGTNPLNILRTLNQARENVKEREQREQTLQALTQLTPGAGEEQLAAIVKPEDVSFVPGGVVMAYPRYSMEFYVAEGRVRLVQQPSFLQLSRQQAAIFYAPKVQWARCTPEGWRGAQP
jgi:hypothetical protein